MIVEHPASPAVEGYLLKAGQTILVAGEAHTITSVEKMEGDPPHFISGPDGKVAVAIRLGFDGHDPILIHPRVAVLVLET